MTITLIHGDALVEVPNLQKRYSTCIFDPPAELSPHQVRESLKQCHQKADSLAFYGRNPDVMVSHMLHSPWPVHGIMPILSYRFRQPHGFVVYSHIHMPSPIYIETEKGFGGHPTAKGKDWFIPVLLQNEVAVLDPFAGLGDLGEYCAEKGIDYTAIELDDEYFAKLSERLSAYVS